MGNKMIHRIDLLRKHNKMSLNALDKKTGMGNGYFGRQIKSEGNVGSHVVEKIYSIFDVSAEWLLGDDVPMQKKYSLPEENISMVAESEQSTRKSILTDFDKMVLKSLQEKEVKAYLEELIKRQMTQ